MVTSGAARSSTVRPSRSLDPAVAAPRPHRQPLRQHFRRRRDRNHHDIGIGPAHRADHRARDVGDHRAAGADIVIDRARQRIAMAVRLPVHGIFALLARAGGIHPRSPLIVLGGRRFARHHAARKDDVAILGAGGPRKPAAACPCRRRSGRPPGRAGRARSRPPSHAAMVAVSLMPHAPFPPDAAHHRNVAGDMHADQVGALADRDLAAVGKPDRFGRRLGDGADRGRQIDRGNVLAAVAARAINRLEGM